MDLGELSLRVPSWGAGRLEEIMIKLNILRGTFLEVIWGHDKGALCL